MKNVIIFHLQQISFLTQSTIGGTLQIHSMHESSGLNFCPTYKFKSPNLHILPGRMSANTTSSLPLAGREKIKRFKLSSHSSIYCKSWETTKKNGLTYDIWTVWDSMNWCCDKRVHNPSEVHGNSEFPFRSQSCGSLYSMQVVSIHQMCSNRCKNDSHYLVETFFHLHDTFCHRENI